MFCYHSHPVCSVWKRISQVRYVLAPPVEQIMERWHAKQKYHAEPKKQDQSLCWVTAKEHGRLSCRLRLNSRPPRMARMAPDRQSSTPVFFLPTCDQSNLISSRVLTFQQLDGPSDLVTIILYKKHFGYHMLFPIENNWVLWLVD